MHKMWHTGLIILAAIAVAVADVLIKKIAIRHDRFMLSFVDPYTIVVVLLYVIQIIIFAYVFFHKAELSSIGIIQAALYAIVIIGSGVLFFGEKITLLHGLGIALAIAGVVLLNI